MIDPEVLKNPCPEGECRSSPRTRSAPAVTNPGRPRAGRRMRCAARPSCPSVRMSMRRHRTVVRAADAPLAASSMVTARRGFFLDRLDQSLDQIDVPLAAIGLEPDFEAVVREALHPVSATAQLAGSRSRRLIRDGPT